jgi:hypothetical protein
LKSLLIRGLFAASLVVCAAACGTPAATLGNATRTSTDSVDLFRPDVNAGKSPALAMAASIILPGVGHQYLDRNHAALAYLSVEAVSIFSFLFCDLYANKTAQDAAGYAWIHAQAGGTMHNADDYRWKLVGSFMDVQEYNNVMDLNRSPEKKITDESQAWYWDDVSSKDRFNAIRATSRSYRIISNFFIGAMVLNRVVAFIDIRTTSRNKGIKSSAFVPHDFTPIVFATPNSLDFALSGSF